MFHPGRTLKMNDSDRTACRFKFITIPLSLVALAREKRIRHVRRSLPGYPRPISHPLPSRLHLIHSDYLLRPSIDRIHFNDCQDGRTEGISLTRERIAIKHKAGSVRAIAMLTGRGGGRYSSLGTVPRRVVVFHEDFRRGSLSLLLSLAFKS